MNLNPGQIVDFSFGFVRQIDKVASMPARLKLVCVTLFVALFYSPLSAALTNISGGLFRAGIVELCLCVTAIVWGLTLFLRGRAPVPSQSTIDLFMLCWLFFGGIALVKTYDLHESIFSALIVLRYLFVIPVAYFVLRVCAQTKAECEQVLFIYIGFLKIATVYMLVEFLAVNFFGMRLVLERFFLQSPHEERLYDSIFRAFLKPAGPIHGSQNASLVALIATFSFASIYRSTRKHSEAAWTMLALLSLSVSFTITAAIAAIALLFTLGIPLIRGIPIIYARIVAVFSALIAALYRKEILAFRDKGVSGIKSIYYERTLTIINASTNRFLEGISSHPFGTGWPNHIASEESPAFQPFLTSPPEVFLFKLGHYLGPFFLIYFIAIHLFMWVRLIRLRRRNPSDLGLQFIIVTVLSLFISLIHYESFTRSGFSYLYAFCLTMLATYRVPSTSRQNSESRSRLTSSESLNPVLTQF